MMTRETSHQAVFTHGSKSWFNCLIWLADEVWSPYVLIYSLAVLRLSYVNGDENDLK